jgi:hypothetical protein
MPGRSMNCQLSPWPYVVVEPRCPIFRRHLRAIGRHARPSAGRGSFRAPAICRAVPRDAQADRRARRGAGFPGTLAATRFVRIPAALGFVRWFHPTSKPAAYPRLASAEALACARRSRARAACLPRRHFVRIPVALGFVRWFHPSAGRPLTSTRVGQGSRPGRGPKAGAAQEQARSRQHSQVHSRAGRKRCQRRCWRPEHAHSGRPGRGIARPPA